MKELEHELDFERLSRQGFAEAVLAEPKTMTQLKSICEAFEKKGQACLLTRLCKERQKEVASFFTQGKVEVDEIARTLSWFPKAAKKKKSKALVNLICAGSSDLPVLKEAEATLRFMGVPTQTLVDVGVAGLHRLLKKQDQLKQAQVQIVAAGMDGALATVVAGLVGTPVIALPTSVGYGSSFHGLSALLAMLNSCASGLTVVNIDNGYGAAMAAWRIVADIRS